MQEPGQALAELVVQAYQMIPEQYQSPDCDNSLSCMMTAVQIALGEVQLQCISSEKQIELLAAENEEFRNQIVNYEQEMDQLTEENNILRQQSTTHYDFMEMLSEQLLSIKKIKVAVYAARQCAIENGIVPVSVPVVSRPDGARVGQDGDLRLELEQARKSLAMEQQKSAMLEKELCKTQDREKAQRAAAERAGEITQRLVAAEEAVTSLQTQLLRLQRFWKDTIIHSTRDSEEHLCAIAKELGCIREEHDAVMDHVISRLAWLRDEYRGDIEHAAAAAGRERGRARQKELRVQELERQLQRTAPCGLETRSACVQAEPQKEDRGVVELRKELSEAQGRYKAACEELGRQRAVERALRARLERGAQQPARDCARTELEARHAARELVRRYREQEKRLESQKRELEELRARQGGRAESPASTTECMASASSCGADGDARAACERLRRRCRQLQEALRRHAVRDAAAGAAGGTAAQYQRAAVRLLTACFLGAPAGAPVGPLQRRFAGQLLATGGGGDDAATRELRAACRGVLARAARRPQG